MGFIMDGLDAEAYDRSYSDRQLIDRIFSYFRPHLTAMSIVAVTIVLNSLMDSALPVLISRGIDTVSSGTTFANAALLVAAFLVSGVLSWVFNYIRQSYSARTVGEVVYEIRRDAFDAVLARDMSFYDEFSSGKIVSRVTSDTQDFA